MYMDIDMDIDMDICTVYKQGYKCIGYMYIGVYVPVYRGICTCI